MHLGVALPILEYTPLPWTTNWWITNVREFLHHIHSTIHIAIIQQHDIHLMNAFQNEGYNTTNLKILNHCRLTLQVTTLTKITGHTGYWLIPEALLNGPSLPTLQAVSKSNHVWPQQPSPSKIVWTLWTKAIWATFTKPDLPNQIQKPLGPWTPNAALNCTWQATFNPIMQEV